MSRGALLALLGVMVVGGAGAWWVLGGSARPARTPPAVNDDLDLVVALLDGAAAEPPRDLLVATAAERYLARASDRAVVAFAAGDAGTARASRDGGPRHGERTLAVLDAPARGMALAGGSLWVTSGHAVERIPVAGGAPSVVAGGLAHPGAIATDERWLFVVDAEEARGGLTHANTVVRLSVESDERVVLGRSEGEVTNVVLDDTDVYWADRLEGEIVAASKAGGPPRVLATGRGLPGELRADADSLYWIEKRSESLWTMPRAGGTPRQLVQDFAGFGNLVADARGVVWSNEAAVDGAFRVLTVTRGGGEVTPVSVPVESIDAIASDGARLWWARGGAVAEVAAAPDPSR